MIIELIMCAAAVTGLIFTLVFIARQPRQQSQLIAGPTFGPLTEPLANVTPISQHGKEQLAKDLVRSGNYHSTAMENYLATRNVALMVWCVCIALLVSMELVTPTFWFWAIAIAGAVLLVGIPRAILSLNSHTRAHRMTHDLPDALDLLAMMMSGGMTMQESLRRVIGEFDDTHPALATELGIVSRQAESGSLDEALIMFGERLDLPEVTALTAMLRGGHRAGGSLTESLRSFADGLRHARDQTARERGNKAAIKLLLPVVFCLAPPIYILLLGPAFLELRDFVRKENQPGGVLVPSVSTVRNPQAYPQMQNERLDTSPDRFTRR